MRSRFVPAFVLVLLTAFVLPFRSVAQAASAGDITSSPFILRNPTTGAQVQVMPTRQWLANHTTTSSVTNAGSTSTSTATPSGALPSPTCTLATDDSPGDAHVLVNTTDTQFDSLDFTALGLSSDASNITGQVSVESLSDGTPVSGTPAPATPAVAGGADIWYVTWTYGNTPGVKGYFLEAQYPGLPGDPGYANSAATSGLPVDFEWGTIGTSPTGGTQFTNGGAATGSFNTSTNTISITAPLSTVGAPPVGSVLSAPTGEGDALLGTPATGGLLETADSITSSSSDYKVGDSGTNCPGPASSSTGGALPTQGSSNNLSYYGGPVVHTIHNYLIWWLPRAGTTTYSDGSSCTVPGTVSYSYEQPASGTIPVGALPGGPDGDADYQSILTQYFQDLSGTSFYNLLSQYADQETGATNNNETLGGTWTDNCGYTSTNGTATGTVPGGTDAAPIYQQDIQAEVQKAIQVNHWPDGMDNEYFVFTGYGAADCFSLQDEVNTVPGCSVAGPNPGYCAYHGDFQDGSGNYVLYADMADGAFAANPSTINLCYTAPIGVSDPTHVVNGKSVTDPIADAEVSITSHEEFETVNDAQVGTAQQLAPPLAWYDAVNGEIGDKCAYTYGNYASDGSNIVLRGDHYIVQREYSNWNNGCALTPYQGNGGYGGAGSAVAVQKGWNLIGVPVSGITDTSQLVASMTAPGQLPAGSIVEVQTYHNGKYSTYFPGKGKALPLARTDGVLVESNTAGTWTPTGTLYTSAPTIQLNPGWNLVAATYPNPGLTTDAIYNQIAAEAGACSAAILTNGACSPTVTEIKSIGAGGQTIDWKPTASSGGNAVWPQTTGNQIPFTSGMWIYASKALTWTVQGSQCQSVDSAGVCH